MRSRYIEGKKSRDRLYFSELFKIRIHVHMRKEKYNYISYLVTSTTCTRCIFLSLTLFVNICNNLSFDEFTFHSFNLLTYQSLNTILSNFNFRTFTFSTFLWCSRGWRRRSVAATAATTINFHTSQCRHWY